MKLFKRRSQAQRDLDALRAFLAGVVTAGGEAFYRSHICEAVGGDLDRADRLITIASQRGFIEAFLYFNAEERIVKIDRPVVSGDDATYRVELKSGRIVNARGSEMFVWLVISDAFRDACVGRPEHQQAAAAS